MNGMLKRVTTFILTVVMTVATLFTTHVTVEAASNMKISQDGIDVLKKMEGFAKYPYWDYSQWTVGYGSYCKKSDLERFQRDGITEEEAETLLKEHAVDLEKGTNWLIDKYGLSLNQGQFDALCLFTYNVGASWMYNSTGIRKAVLNNYTGSDFVYEISRWHNAGGSVLTGLIKRRLSEADMYLHGRYSANWPDSMRYVRLNANGGSVGSKVQGFQTDDSVSIKPSATRSGYVFDGWYTSATGGTKIKTLDSSIKTGTTLYAHWINKTTETPKDETTEAPKDETTTKPEETPTTPVEPETPKEDATTKPVEPETPEAPKDEGNENSTSGNGVVYNCYSLRVRNAPGKNSDTVAYLKVGDKVTITETKTVDETTWGKMSKGWVSMNCIKLDKPVETPKEETPTTPETKPEEKPAVVSKTGKITCLVLNVRENAGTNYKRVGRYYIGNKVTITETKTAEGMEWGKTDKGWIATKYVKFDAAGETSKEEPSEPTTTPTPTPQVQTGTIVNCTFLTIRRDAGTKNQATGWYKVGTEVNIYETKEANGKKWGKTEKGWISLSYVELGEFKAFTGTVTANGLRIRQNPSLSAKVLGSVNKGQTVKVTEVKAADGMQWGKTDKGWISLNYVRY